MTHCDEQAPTRRAALVGMVAAAVTAAGAGFGPNPVNAATIRTDKGFSSLQGAINACKAGDELEIRRNWSIGVSVKVNKPLTLRCVGGGAVATTADVHAFNVTSSGVKLVNVRVTGNGAAAGTQSIIRADGTARTPLKGLVVRGCTISRSRKNGVEMHHASGFTIERNTIRDVAYAGIMILSGQGGQIFKNNVVNVTQPQGFVNSYGIVLTRNWAEPLSTAPRTTGTLVSGNLVDGVRKWEGIDSHAGVNITIDNNTIRNAFIGISVVPCRDASGAYKYAPKGIKVRNNTIDSGVRNGTCRAGIQLLGAGDVKRVAEYAEGEISGNTVVGFGNENYSSGAAILTNHTKGSTIKDNVLKESSPSGVCVYHNNVGLKIVGNAMIDTWTNTSDFTACVHVWLPEQSLTVRGNKAGRARKKAKKVNDRGLFIAPAAKSPTVTVITSGNDFTACAKP